MKRVYVDDAGGDMQRLIVIETLVRERIFCEVKRKVAVLAVLAVHTRTFRTVHIYEQ